ncbi:MAG TPA: S9 family peptidase [Gemmatimonadaceae bacterium]|nr:S9 family peptidase [Gemmatimonadaceae bacterium]
MRSMLVVAAAMLLAARPATAQQHPGERAGRAFTPGDWYKVTTVGSPAVSPDGKLVAFTVTTVRERENKRHSEVWMVSTTCTRAQNAKRAASDDDCAPVRLTSPSTESSDPRFSADGKLLYFTSTRPGVRGRTWALHMDRAGEAFVADDAPNASASMSRDGGVTVWTQAARGDSASESDSLSASTRRRDRDPYAGMQPMARPPYGAITHPLDAKRFDGRQIVDMRYKANGRGFIPGPRTARVWRPSHLWVQRAGDTAAHQLDSALYSHRDAVVSPDGKWIAFTADAELRPDSVVSDERDSIAKLPYDSARDEAPRNDIDIFVVPATGGTPRRVTKAVGDERRLAWSPDGKRISFVSAPSRMKSQRLYVVDASGGEPVNLLGDWQYEPQDYDWLPNGEISFSAAIGGRTALLRLDPKTRKIREVLSGRRQMRGFAYDAAKHIVAYVSTSIDTPTELYVADVDGRGEHKLTSFNDALNKEIAWSSADRFTYKSVGGLEIEAWLMKPYGYEPGKKYPLVLYIHGGPHSAYGEGWFDEFQNIAGAGMWVLFTNPRGSSGYGGDFTNAIRGRWGAEDYQDLMKAVDIVAQRPDVDSTRMGVTGGSYGGFMTAWVTTKTTRFKAAEVDRMISDWTYWYGASDAQGLTEFEFYGKPWDNFALYDSLSPIRHVTHVKTPTLLVQSEEDYRAPIGNAELWFMALEKQGVPAEFIRYPRSNHDLSRTGEPWLLVDRLSRLRQWFDHWLQDGKDVAAGGE